MELRHLRYFVAVAEQLSFRGAAGQLNLSGPALSKQIRDLEGEMGVRLLDRDTTRVQLTNSGRVFLEEARELLQRANQAVANAREAHAGRSGRLTIGNIGPLLASYLASALSGFCNRYPDVDVELIDLDLFEHAEALTAGRIQLGFATPSRPESIPAGFHQATVMHASLGVAMNANHRLARAPRVSLAELAAERLFSIKGRHGSFHRDLIKEILDARSLSVSSIVTVDGFESLMAMVAANQGVSILSLRGSISRTENVVMRPIKETGADLVFELCALWRGEPEDALARNFVTELQHVIKPNNDSNEELGARRPATATAKKGRRRNRRP